MDFIDDNDVEDIFDEEECQLKLYQREYFTGDVKVVEAIEFNAYERLTQGNKIKSIRSVGDCCWSIKKVVKRRLKTVYKIDLDNKEIDTLPRKLPFRIYVQQTECKIRSK